jgi:hypothetical protein
VNATRLIADLRVAGACASIALRVQLQYRVSFVLQLLANLLGNLVDFVALWALRTASACSPVGACPSSR